MGNGKEFHRASRVVKRSKMSDEYFFIHEAHGGRRLFAPEKGRRSYVDFYDNPSTKKPKNKKPWQRKYVNYSEANPPKKNSQNGNQHWRKSNRYLPETCKERQRIRDEGLSRRHAIPKYVLPNAYGWNVETYPTNWVMIPENPLHFQN